MYQRGIQMIGTVRHKRVGKCPILSEKEMKNNGRGSFTEHVAKVDDVEVSVVAWFDNKIVTLLSNFVGSEPTTMVKRFSKRENKHVHVSCPNLVTIYNKHMGGVDFLDSLLGYYRYKIRSKKWYHRIFFHLVDMTIVNAWILWRKRNPSTPLVQFKLNVADLLCNYDKSRKTKIGRPSMQNISSRVGPKIFIPQEAIRLDQVGHWPIINESRVRCKRRECSSFTFVNCEKCKIALFLTFSARNTYIYVLLRTAIRIYTFSYMRTLLRLYPSNIEPKCPK